MDRRSFIAQAGAGGLAAPFFVAADSIGPDDELQNTQLPTTRGYVWSGAVTTTAARVTAKVPEPPLLLNESGRLLEPRGVVRIAISESTDDSPSQRTEPQFATRDNDFTLTFDVVGLRPATEYRYVVEVDGRPVPSLNGKFTTFPEGPASFQCCFASCAQTGSRSRVFEAILRQRPAFFLHMGDLHYENIAGLQAAVRRRAYATVHSSPTQRALYRNVPIAYVWDDHDFLGNDSGGESPAGVEARRVYRQCVPHHPLALGKGNQPIAQAFTCGRVRFVLTDLRSARDAKAGTAMGRRQKEWFKAELLRARAGHALIVWMSTYPWIAPASMGADHWGGFAAERREIANFLKANAIRNLCIVSGDAHMLAIDDGTNSDYAVGGGAPIPVFQAAALDQGGSVKGGPYSKGAFPGGGQFGLMRVFDDGNTLRVEWSGQNLDGREIVSHSFRV